MRASTSSLSRFAATAAAVVSAVALAACGSGAQRSQSPVPPASAGTVAATPEEQVRPAAIEVARPTQPVEVFTDPAAGRPTMTLPAVTSFGSARALPVSDRRDGWLEVQLPTRPNGSTGWVRATGVALRTVSFEVRVDLSDRTLEVWEDGDQVLQTSAAIGTAAAPTPIGRFFVVDKVESTSSAYGPFALGLSGHSEVLSEFGGGDGQIGIHGTDDPSSIGRAASHGCVRVPNDVITRLAELLPLGTPVVVVG